MRFGNVAVGSSTAQLVTLTNTGNANLVISSVVASGNGFTESGGSNVTLAPQQSVTASVNFAPTASGSATGTLSVVSNASDSPLPIALSGNGTSPQAAAYSVLLNWSAGTSQVVGYNVYRSSVSGGPYTKLNATVDPYASYTDSGLTTGTDYYVVTSVEVNGIESAYSNQTDAVIP